MSGAGLPWVTSSPATVAVNTSVQPNFASTIAKYGRCDEVATAIRMPRSRKVCSNVSAPGSVSTSCSTIVLVKWRCSRMISSTDSGKANSLNISVALSCARRPTSRWIKPGGGVMPYRARNISSARWPIGSLSISVPSKSNKIASKSLIIHHPEKAEGKSETARKRPERAHCDPQGSPAPTRYAVVHTNRLWIIMCVVR